MQKAKSAIYILIAGASCFAFPNLAAASDPEAMTKKVLCHTCLAKIYVAQDNVPQAIAEFQELLKLTPSDPTVHFDFGNFLARNDKPDLAVPQFKLAAKLKPSVAAYQAGLGNALMYNKDFTGAIAAYNKACSLGGKYQDLIQKAQHYEAQQKLYEQYQKKIQAQKESDN